MHYDDNASQWWCITAMHPGTDALRYYIIKQVINLLLKITTYLITITLIFINQCEKLETISIFNTTYLCVLQRALILSWSAPLNHKRPAGTCNKHQDWIQIFSQSSRRVAIKSYAETNYNTQMIYRRTPGPWQYKFKRRSSHNWYNKIRYSSKIVIWTG